MIRFRHRAAVVTTVVLTILTTLALAPSVGATFPGRNGLIAFHADVGDNGPQIFTVRSNGHQLRQITHVDGVAAQPDWSPDGRQIAFTLNECAIALVDADGANLHEIASDPDAVPQRRELHPGRGTARLHPLRRCGRDRTDVEHEDRRLGPAVHHRRRWARSERLARRPEDQLQGWAGRRLVRREHRRHAESSRSRRRSR